MISGYKIDRYDFMTGRIAGTAWISLHGYEYLDITTDGAINPYANYPDCNTALTQCDPKKLLYLLFDDGEELMINHEQRDYNVAHKKKYKLYYKAPAGGIKTFQGGYGNLYIIRKRFRETYIHYDRKNPEGFYAKGIASMGRGYAWIGENRPNASWTMIIPYVPPGYEILSLRLNVGVPTPGSHTPAWYDPDDDVATGGLSAAAINHYANASSRIYIEIINSHGVMRTMRLVATLLNKSDTR